MERTTSAVLSAMRANVRSPLSALRLAIEEAAALNGSKPSEILLSREEFSDLMDDLDEAPEWTKDHGLGLILFGVVVRPN